MRLEQPEALLLAAAGSLLLAPFLLPKMHDRYFYAFEMTAIILTAVNTRHLSLALGAQMTGLISYLAFVHIDPVAVRMAAAANGLMLWLIFKRLEPYAAAAGLEAPPVDDPLGRTPARCDALPVSAPAPNHGLNRSTSN